MTRAEAIATLARQSGEVMDAACTLIQSAVRIGERFAERDEATQSADQAVKEIKEQWHEQV